MRFFYASPEMVRRWVAGRWLPGVYFKRPSGRASCVFPTGRRVESMYGPIYKSWHESRPT